MFLTLTALAGALALLGAAAALGASASGNAAVSIEPPSQVVQPGESVKIDIAVSGVTNLGAWEVGLKFDPRVLAFESFTEAPWLSSTGRQPFCPEAETDEARGTVLQGCGSIGSTPPGPAGQGVLGRFIFTTKAAGTSNLEFYKVSLVTPLSVDCCGAFTVAEGVVRVGSADGQSGGDTQLPPTPTPNPVKLTPTPVNAQRGDLLMLTPAAGAPAGGSGPPPAATPAEGSGSAPAGTPEESARLGEVAGAASSLFGGTDARAARSGAPIAGTGSRTAVPSGAAAATTAALGVAGLMCIVASGAGRIRTRGGRRMTARPPRG